MTEDKIKAEITAALERAHKAKSADATLTWLDVADRWAAHLGSGWLETAADPEETHRILICVAPETSVVLVAARDGRPAAVECSSPAEAAQVGLRILDDLS